jgi:hypothetical protein
MSFEKSLPRLVTNTDYVKHDLNLCPNPLSRYRLVVAADDVHPVELTNVFEEVIVDAHYAAIAKYLNTADASDLTEFSGITIDGHPLVSSRYDFDRRYRVKRSGR